MQQEHSELLNKHSDIFANIFEQMTKVMTNDMLSLRQLQHAMNSYKLSHTMWQIEENMRDNFFEWYLSTLDRDDGTLNAAVSETGKTIVEYTIGSLPIIAEASSILNVPKRIAELMNKFEAQILDYSETDKQLAIIERHINTLNELIQYLMGEIERFKLAKQNNSPNPTE